MFKAERLIKRSVSAAEMDSVRSRKKELNVKEKDVALLHRCQNIWTNNFDEFRQQRARGNRFYDGDQWADIITVNGKSMTYREYLMQTGNVVIQTNQIKNRVDTIVGVMVKERNEPVCHAIDRDEQPYGELVTTGLQANCDKNVMPELYIKWLKDVCNGGLAISYESYDDYSGPNRRLDSWTKYVNPNMFFCDGDAVDPRFWDFSIIGRYFYGSFEDICARFVKKPSDYKILKDIYSSQSSLFREEESREFTDKFEDDNLIFMRSSDPTRCYVCEVWTKETRGMIRLHDTNSGTEEIIDADDKEYRKQVKAENERRKRLAEMTPQWGDADIPYIIGDGYGKDESERNGFFIDTYWYCRFLAPDGTILWEGESPYADRSHPFNLCIFSYIDGKIVGYTHDAIDHNMAMNRAFITNEWLVRTQAKGVTVVPKAIVPKDVSYEDFAKSWTAIDDLVFIDMKPGMEKLMPQTFYGAAQNYNVAQLIGTIQSLMDNGSPVNGALQGNSPSAGTSGTLYAQMTVNSATPIAALMEQFHDFVLSVLNKKMKKSGVNTSLEFQYFELEDIVPAALRIFATVGLTSVTDFGGETATMTVYNADNPEEPGLTFAIKYREVEQIVSKAGKVVTNAMQALGSSITYMRRYLWMMVLDVTEPDEIDATLGTETEDGEDEAPAKKEPPKAPATPEERKAAKKELTAENKADPQLDELKKLCKTLLAKDEKHEDFVQSIAVKTKSFTKIKPEACKTLIDNIKEILKEYEA